MDAEAPNQTLYVRNLDEKVHPDRIKLLLYTAFSRFGSVLDVVCTKKRALKGQAWIIFREVAQATEAKKGMHGKELFGKEMDIHFAKQKSDVIARMDGTFKPREKRAAQGPAPEPAAKRLNGSDEDPAASSAPPAAAAPASSAAEAPPKPEEQLPPHKTLFAAGLPQDCPPNSLEMLFKQFSGFEQVRLVPSRQIAFVDFTSEEVATAALRELNGFNLDPTHKLQLSYAKKEAA